MTESLLEVSCSELAERIRSSNPPTLLDCREAEEYAIAHLEGSVLIPLQQIPIKLQQIAAIPTELVVYCHHGVRSARAAQWLREQGFPSVQSLAGGIDAWSLEIDPSIPRY